MTDTEVRLLVSLAKPVLKPAPPRRRGLPPVGLLVWALLAGNRFRPNDWPAVSGLRRDELDCLFQGGPLSREQADRLVKAGWPDAADWWRYPPMPPYLARH